MSYSSEEMRKVLLELADDLEQHDRMLKEAQVQASLMTSEESEAVERSLLGGMTWEEVAAAAGSGLR